MLDGAVGGLGMLLDEERRERRGRAVPDPLRVWQKWFLAFGVLVAELHAARLIVAEARAT